MMNKQLVHILERALNNLATVTSSLDDAKRVTNDDFGLKIDSIKSCVDIDTKALQRIIEEIKMKKKGKC